MWALIEDGSITKLINNPRGMIIDNIQYSRNIFSFRWSNEEREAIGLYEVVFDNTNKKDEAYYTNTNQSFAFADGVVTASFGSATAKLLEDRNEVWSQEQIDSNDAPDGTSAGDPQLDEKGNQIVTKGLKTKKIKIIKQQAAGILAETDWYIVRKADANTAVPSAITNHRAAVRTKCAAMETLVTNASNTAAIETLYTPVNTADEGDPVVMERPLGELPTLEA
jgi:hypothetical protein